MADHDVHYLLKTGTASVSAVEFFSTRRFFIDIVDSQYQSAVDKQIFLVKNCYLLSTRVENQ